MQQHLIDIGQGSICIRDDHVGQLTSLRDQMSKVETERDNFKADLLDLQDQIVKLEVSDVVTFWFFKDLTLTPFAVRPLRPSWMIR